MLHYRILTLLTELIVLSRFGWCYEIKNIDLFPSLPVDIVTENALCREQSKLFVDNLKNFSLWAHEMRDATAKSTTGVLRGSIFQLGQFEECLTADAPFPTQYCLANVEADIPPLYPPRDPKSLHYHRDESVFRKLYNHGDPSQIQKNKLFVGWCMPASCNLQDLQETLNRHMKTVDLKNNVTYTGSVFELGCQTEQEAIHRNPDYLDVTFCTIVLIVCTLIILSTTYDYIVDEHLEDKLSQRSVGYKMCTSFSLRKNFSKLSKSDGSSPALTILYGMRTFCILMIIMDHRFGTHLPLAVLNFDMAEVNYRSLVGTLFFHGDLFVDSFFVLSGLLVTYSLLVQFEKRIMNPGFIIFLRYIRLTPIYAFVILYYATALNYTGFGPFWKMTITQESLDCRTNWWANLLYISNYVNTKNMCIVQSWYLPCDFHYFIIAIGLCILIKKDKNLGLGALAGVTLVSVIIPFAITYVYESPAVLHFYPEFLSAPKLHKHFGLTYIKSHTRATPYFVGMIAGYIYYKMKDSVKKVSTMKSYLIILVSLILMVASLITGVIFYNPYYEYNALESAAYGSLHRTVWSIGSVGVLYIASFGRARFIYRFLSWSPWIPLSKLVYGAYLIHMQFQIIAMAKKASPTVISYYDIITLALSDMVLSFSAAFVLYLCIEAPFRNIFQVFLMPKRKESISDTNNIDSRSDIRI